MSKLSSRFFKKAAEKNLHLALATLPVKFFESALGGVEHDSETLTCLRSCLMKPVHLEWVEKIYGILDRTMEEL